MDGAIPDHDHSELLNAEAEEAMEEENEIRIESTQDSKRLIRTSQEIIDYWQHQFENEKLSCHHFREWWRMQVPKILQPIPSMDLLYPMSHVDDAAVTEILISTIEQFMCDDPNPEKVFKGLAENNHPPSVCGKLFKMGEPTYSCRDCGHDATCVLCVECFKHSEHQNHRYKISTSNGGGYCDCGDPEAWSKYVHCANHKQGAATGQMDTEDLINQLPENIRLKAKHVFAAVLDYIYETLTTESNLKLPPDLTYKSDHEELDDFNMESNDDYVTMIYNDEFHRYDDVIDTIPRAM